jgi:adenosyl cobinamide kinase/adenosyl cobinamide phosphate guanylyltransferase
VITLVLGGSGSGKSAVAERLAAGACAGAGAGARVTYIATGSAVDDDMAARIAAHRDRRDPLWDTVEAGAALVDAVREAKPHQTVLIDALGTWVAAWPDFGADANALVDALFDRSGHTVVVSDEVGMGVHPETDVGRRFRDALGRVNQVVAAAADEVLLVVAGRALRLDRVEGE